MKDGESREFQGSENHIKQLLRNALVLRRQAIVYSVARKFIDCFESAGLSAGEPAVESSGWIRVESLSQLRSIVGGRFQNLREKWLRAGFPLREHRGDRSAKASVDQDGWLELAVWIGNQGYEVKLAGENDPWLFELRAFDTEGQRL